MKSRHKFLPSPELCACRSLNFTRFNKTEKYCSIECCRIVLINQSIFAILHSAPTHVSSTPSTDACHVMNSVGLDTSNTGKLLQNSQCQDLHYCGDLLQGQVSNLSASICRFLMIPLSQILLRHPCEIFPRHLRLAIRLKSLREEQRSEKRVLSWIIWSDFLECCRHQVRKLYPL